MSRERTERPSSTLPPIPLHLTSEFQLLIRLKPPWSSVSIRLYTTQRYDNFCPVPNISSHFLHVFVCGWSASAAVVTAASSSSLNPITLLWPSSSSCLAVCCTFSLSQPPHNLSAQLLRSFFSSDQQPTPLTACT